MKLWLVRHARPLIAAGVCYGSTDMLADATHTLATAQRLAPLLPPHITVWTSPMRRCQSLAQQLLALRPDLHLRVDARLREMDFGCWEGVRWDDIPRAAYDEWTANFGRARFGGQESVNELMQRVAHAHEEARANMQAEEQDTAWVTHAGVLRAVQLLAQGHAQLHQAPQWPRAVAGWGEWEQMNLDPFVR